MTLLSGIPMVQYVADAFHAGPASLNSSTAHRLLTRSPLHAWTAHPRLNPAWEQDDDRAFDLGTAAHGVLLEGRELFVVDYPDYRTKQAQAVRDEAKACGKLPVLAHQARAIREMVSVARRAMAESPDLVDLGPLVAEQTCLWEFGGARLRCRPDWVAKDHGVIISYKTTAANGEPTAFVRVLTSMGYDVQAAFELAGVKAATGVDARYVWLVQECEPPYECSFPNLTPMGFETAMAKYRRAATVWADCMARGQWHGYPKRIVYMDPPVWDTAAFMERHGYEPAPSVDDGRPLAEQLGGA